MQLTGNTIIITGGTSGIGRALAEAFARLGNVVIISGRRIDRMEELRKSCPQIIARVADLSDEAERNKLAEWVISNYPETNMLVNNAGIQLTADLTRPVDLQRIREEVEINFIAPVHLASLFAAHLSTKNNAAIVNISSGLAFTPLAFIPVYSATKAAIHSLTLSLRFQLKNSGVKVFEIAPPSVDTELGHDRRPDKNQTHGGIPVESFIEDALRGLESDEFETAVQSANHLREKRELLFEAMNGRGHS